VTTSNARFGARQLTNIGLVTPLLLLVVVVQATLVARVRFLGVSPNLLLVVVVSWGLLRGIQSGLAWAFVGGLLFDLVAGLPLGASSLALMVTCFLSSLSENNLFQGNLTLPVVLTTLATPIYGWILLLIRDLTGGHVNWLGVTLNVILRETLLNVVVVIVVYPALRWLALRLGIARMNW
jgi:rod shape-determining protein MreD